MSEPVKINRWKIEKVKLSDCVPQADNPRSITGAAIRGLRKSIERFGYVEPIVWNKTTKHIVSGHQRHSILLKEGVKEATVIVVEMTDAEERAASLTMNNPTIEGDWDEPALELLEQVKSSDSDLYLSLRLDDLEKSIRENEPNVTVDDGEDVQSTDPQKVDFDTTCPCCGHKFNVEAGNVRVEGL